MIEAILYKIGETAKIGGLYVCVPCGYKRRFKVGDIFPQCLNCMRVSRPLSEIKIQEEFFPNLETWELLQED